MQLDLSILDDDQLEALFVAVCEEAMQRGPAMSAAIREAGLSAAERARVAHEAAGREAAKMRAEEEARIAREAAERVRLDGAGDQTRRNWGVRKGIALALKTVVTDLCKFPMADLEIELWQKGADRRLYVGYGFGKNLFAYHVTGGQLHPPGTVEVLRADKDLKANKDQLRALGAAIAAALTGTGKVSMSTALAWEGDAVQLSGFEPRRQVVNS